MSAYWNEYWRKHESLDDPLRQVGRTLNRRPMSREMLGEAARRYVEALEFDSQHAVLDFCCGNGLLSVALAAHCRYVVGVDFSQKLLQGIDRQAGSNIFAVAADAGDVQFRAESFDRILYAAAIQHLSQPKAIRAFRHLESFLKPGGLLLVTDIPDADRIWNYFDSSQREDAYFENTMAEQPILGTWFDRIWLQKLARNAGFAQAEALDQPESYWYSHYRFDLLCRKRR